MPFKCSVTACKGNYNKGPKVSLLKFRKIPILGESSFRLFPRAYFQITEGFRLCWAFVLLAGVAIPSDARDPRPMDCQEWQAAGYYTTGVYTVWLGGNAVRVRCDMDTDGGGWTVIQRRGNFSHQQSFDFYWKDYKNGIGNAERDYWLGNDNIFALTNQGNYSLRLDMAAVDGQSAYALFQEFRIEDEKTNYKLHVCGYSGTAGDSLTDLDSAMFTTKDRNNDEQKKIAGNCAKKWKGGLWYRGCAFCNPNGLYKPGETDGNYMYYDGFHQNDGLFSFEMKVKRS